jgi:hypothetical protein
LELVIAMKVFALAGSGLAVSSYVFSQVANSIQPNTVPDAIGTTVLTVGGGGLALAIAAISKDFWTYKKELVASRERQAKEERESLERIEKAKLDIERLRITQAKNNRVTNAMWGWMKEVHETGKFPPPPPRVHLTDDPLAVRPGDGQ